jgi:hypothetical protein
MVCNTIGMCACVSTRTAAKVSSQYLQQPAPNVASWPPLGPTVAAAVAVFHDGTRCVNDETNWQQRGRVSRARGRMEVRRAAAGAALVEERGQRVNSGGDKRVSPPLFKCVGELSARARSSSSCVCVVCVCVCVCASVCDKDCERESAHSQRPLRVQSMVSTRWCSDDDSA